MVNAGCAALLSLSVAYFLDACCIVLKPSGCAAPVLLSGKQSQSFLAAATAMSSLLRAALKV